MRDDRELVSLARAGDREAFAALVARHGDLLRATTRRAAGQDVELAADAAQEALLTAMLNLDRLRDPAAFGPWLAGIGLNATRHALRDRRAVPFAARAGTIAAETAAAGPAEAGTAAAETAIAGSAAAETAAAGSAAAETAAAETAAAGTAAAAETAAAETAAAETAAAGTAGAETAATAAAPAATKRSATAATAATPIAATAADDDIDAHLDDRAAAARIRHAIAALPPGQREAVALFYLAGLTQAEAAEHLGVPPSAVKARLHKARATLRRRLHPLWKEQYAVSDLIPMRVAEVRRSNEGGHHLIMLEEVGAGGRRLPIWVGMPEAFAIAGLLERVELPRPGPYDFAASLLRATGAAVAEVRVSRLVESVFYADVVLQDGTTVDARPSDALALALTTGAPVKVASAVLDETADASAIPAGDAGALATARVTGVEYQDQRALAEETRERLARQAAELKRT